jgi:hopanoid biosynthesis associated RND transporter like protein HpnN
MTLARLLEILVARACRRAGLTVLLGIVLGALCVWVASERLGISTDTDRLFSDSLPWRQQDIAFSRDFPQFKDLLVAVVDGATPEVAEQTAADLATAMAADPAHFHDVRRPDASPYLQQNGLLFLGAKPLGALLDATIDAQPFLGQLAADPSARGLFGALGLIGMGLEHGQAGLSGFTSALDAFHASLAASLAGKPVPLSWENLLAGSLAEQAGRFHFVLAHPALDYDALEPGGASSDALRAAAAKLEFVRAGLAHVRLTGDVALSDEEFSTVAQGAAAATIGSVLLVLLWLTLALRSWRLIVPIVGTLVLGLLLTTGFAALAVGRLNLISVAFAVLFVGIAVDFAIQFCVRMREMRLATGAAGAALEATARVVGPQILVAALATAAGFLAFVPTDFSGVAELGLIAGGGMIFAFLCTLIFLPAALALCRPRPEMQEIGLAWAGYLERRMLSRRRLVLVVAGLIGVAGLVALPHLTFDSDPLHTKNPHTEAMEALSDLMDDPLTNPYSIDIVAANQAEADALAEKLRGLPLVADVLTLSSFVPEDQATKRALLEDAAGVLAPTLSPHGTPAPVTAEDIRLAASTALAQLEAGAKAAAKPEDAAPVRPIIADLRALTASPDATLLAANEALTRFLPLQLDRLRLALAAKTVTQADIPADFAADWRLPDGRARVQVLSRASARDSQGLHDFVAQLRTIAPRAGGSAVTIVETARTIVGAFRTAAIGAVIAIAILLLVVLRRILDTALVLAPLLLSSLFTVLLAVLIGLPLNFANIIALPLLLGVGVSFNIYFVMNWRAGARRFLGTATARAILFSALTTGTAFGSLALSAHPGTASMGKLLLLSLAATLLVTWLALPALLSVLRPVLYRTRC